MSAHTLNRDCPATAIPSGTPRVLEAGSTVYVVQALGGSVTVRTADSLCRIGPEDASAIDGFTQETGAGPQGAPAGFGGEDAVWQALKGCFDPEIPVNIVDLGLVYDLSIEPGPTGAPHIDVAMTLTAQGCGMGPTIAEDARRRIAGLPGVGSARVHIVWDPVWNPRMISPDGRRALGLE